MMSRSKKADRIKPPRRPKEANYFAGRRAEYRTMELLEKAGFLCIRAAGSKGPADVVAIGNGPPLLVQVKRESSRKRGLNDVEREKLEGVARRYHCIVMVHTWKKHARQPIVEEIR
jgi:Holliday junction resolvase